MSRGTKGLSRGNGLVRHAPMSRGNGGLSRGNGPARAPGIPRDCLVTGVPTLEAQQARCRERDGNRCARCGRPAPAGNRQHQHRQPRGKGGRQDAHRLSALVLMCGWSATDPDGCHNHVESYRDEARRDGYLVPMGVDPEEWPILWHGGWVLLDDDGGITPCDSPASV